MERTMTRHTRCRYSAAGLMFAAMMVGAMTNANFAQSTAGGVPTEIRDAVGRALTTGNPTSSSAAVVARQDPYPRLNAPTDVGVMPAPQSALQPNIGQYVPPRIGVSPQSGGMYETVQADPAIWPLQSFDTSCGCECGDTIGPQSPRGVCGFHCVGGDCEGPAPGICAWSRAGPIPFEAFSQGDYIGPVRTPHVPEYRLRVDDEIDFVFRLTGEASAGYYKLQVGDVIRVESLSAPGQNRDNVTVQPDGYVTLAIAGSVRAAGRTVSELSDDLDDRYSKEIRNPGITVSPVTVNTVLEEFRNTIDNRRGIGGQSRRGRVTPAGKIQLPAIGSVHAQGLTIAELKREIEAAYRYVVTGLEVTPILEERAPRYIYVVGEVDTPGRFTLEGPTTVMQAIALAGSWRNGANLKQVIVFRRDEQWNLMAARLNVYAALYGQDPCPGGEVWLRDQDIVLVPKHPILVLDDAIELIFSRGIYGVVPVFFGGNLGTL